MTPIRFYSFPRKEVQRIAPLSPSFLCQWEAVRPGVLDDKSVDIFCRNIRSEKHGDNVRFDLFQQVDNVSDTSTVIVCNSWLELLNADGQHHKIADLMNDIRSRYPLNPIVWSWNSDTDEATVSELQDLPENEFVLSYNTSNPSPNDILLPFWTIDVSMKWDVNATRVYHGGFIGYVGGVKVRQEIKRAFEGKTGWFIKDTTQVQQSQSVYLEYMLQWDFALCPRGGGLSSYRFWEALQCGCIPILFSDTVRLPYPNLPWPDLIVHLPEELASNFDGIMSVLQFVNVELRRKRLAEVRQMFMLGGVQAEIYKRLLEHLS